MIEEIENFLNNPIVLLKTLNKSLIMEHLIARHLQWEDKGIES